jgi:hypothetical protein
MRRLTIPMLALAVMATALPLTSPAKPRDGPPPPVDCAKVAATSGVSLESCEQMNAAQLNYYNATHDPSASHPGDDQMTCEQIEAELMSGGFHGPSQQQADAARASTGDYVAKQQQLAAEETAASAQLSAEATAASAVGMANPVAGEAAQRAVDAHAEATENSLDAQAKAELTPRGSKMVGDVSNIAGSMGGEMAANPRLARLIQLGGAKHCH